MSKCLYTYQGKEFSSKEEISNFIKETTASPTVSYTITGTQTELEVKQAAMESEAQYEYGTTEFMSFSLTDEGLEVTIDTKAIEDINSGEKLLRNEATGEYESVNLDNLIERERNGETIPEFRSWQEEKIAHLAGKAAEKYLEDLVAAQQTETKTDIKEALLGFANKMGISIETIESYLKDKKLKDNAEVEDLEGLADIFAKIIALNETGNVVALTEEVSHFAVEWYSDQAVIEKMLDKVNQTDTYKRESERYREMYRREDLQGEQLERKVRKEVLGKILAEKIKDNFNQESTTSLAEQGIIAQLKELWNKLTSLFNNNQEFLEEFGAILDKIAYDVIDNRESEFTATDSKEVYYAISKDEAQKAVRDNLNATTVQLKSLYRQLKKDDSLSKSVRTSKLNEALNLIAENEYVQTLNALIAVLYLDIEKASRLVAESKTSGKSLKEVASDSDLGSIITFITSAPSILNALKAEADDIGKKGMFSENADKNATLASGIKSKLANMSIQLENSRPALRDFYNEEGSAMMEQFFIDAGITDPKAIEEMRREATTNEYKNINWWGRSFASIRDAGSYLLKTVNAMITQAEYGAKRDGTNWALDLREIINKHGLEGSPLVTWLTSNKRMRNPLDLAAVQKLEREEKEEIEKEFDAKIEAAKTKEERKQLTEDKFLALNQHDRQWRVSRTNYAFDQKLDNLKISRATRSIIKSRSAEKYQVLKKYQNADNSINYEAISKRDLLLLERIDANYKMQLSEFDNGTKKEGQSLEVARELRRYQESFQNEDEGVDSGKFQADRQSIISKVGVDTAEVARIDAGGKPTTEAGERYRTWLSQNAIFNYDEETMNAMEFGGEIEVDTETTLNKLRRDAINSIGEGATDIQINTFIDRRITLLAEVAGVDLRNRVPRNEIVLNEIYNGLLNKRKELISPYRKKDKAGEIQGELVDENKELLDALFEIDNARRTFKTVSGNMNIVTEANDAFVAKLNSLQGREKRDFAARVDKNNVPTDYHYRRVVVEGGKKEWQPNFRYRLNNEFTQNINPAYIEELAGKTIQYDMTNPKISAFIDNEFYETFGIDRTNDPYGIKNGATKNKGLWELRQFLLVSKETVDKEYALANSYYSLPQVIADMREVSSLKRKAVEAYNMSKFRNMGVNDETTYSTQHSEIIPQRYTRELPDQDLLTTNISTMFGAYVIHGAKYKRLNEVVPKIHILREKVRNGKIKGGGDINNSGVLEIFNKHLSIHVYGNLVDETENISDFLNNFSKTKDISGAKFIKATQAYIRDTNLALNPFTPVVGAITSTVDNLKYILADNLVDKRRAGFINKEVAKWYISHYADIGSNKPTTFAKNLMEYAGINIAANELIDGITKGKIFRMSNNPTMAAYANAGVQSGLLAVVAMYDGHRLIGDKFYNISQWRELANNEGKSEEEADKQWTEAEANSYYNFLNKDGKRVRLDSKAIKDAGYKGSIEELENRILRVTDIYWNRIESQAVTTDRPHVAANPFMGFVMTHSMWFFNFINNAARDKQYNIEEQRWEEGRYRTASRMLKDMVTNPQISWADKAELSSQMLGSMLTMGYYAKGLEGLEEFEKTNIRQIAVESYAYATMTLAFVLMNLAADDDEDNAMKQYLAFIASRALSEQASQTSIFAGRGILDKIKSPIAGHKYMAQIWDLPLIFTPKGGDIVKSGTYKGLSKRQAAILKFSIMKNGMYAIDPAYKFRKANLFFRSSLFKMENQLLEAIEGEE